jgi:hypothetical protein
VQPGVHTGMPLEDLDERQITARIGLLENMVKIANGLMRVNEENQMELRRHGN